MNEGLGFPLGTSYASLQPLNSLEEMAGIRKRVSNRAGRLHTS